MGKSTMRVLLALLVTTVMALTATSLLSGAAAQTAESLDTAKVAPGLTLFAEHTGEGNEVFVQLEGCTKGGTVRLLVDGQPIGDYTIPASGRLTTTVSYPSWVPGNVMKAYCFNTGGFVFADILDADDGDDDDKATGGGVAALIGQNCKFFTDFSGLNVAGNTFIPAQSYGIVGLFPGPVLGAVDIFTDVSAGDVLVTSNGAAIIKIALCKPGGKPGYTPGGLTVVAKLVGNGTNINFKVIGCAAGNTVQVFVDGVFQASFIVNPSDQLNSNIPATSGANATFKAICKETGAFGIVPITTPGSSSPKTTAVAPETTTLVVGGVEDVGEIGEAVFVDESDSGEKVLIVEAKQSKESAEKLKAREAALTGAKEKAAATKAKAGDGGGVVVVIEAEALAVSSAAIELPPLEDGAPDGGTEGLGTRSVASPLNGRAASSGAGSTGSSIPQAQVGLGMLSAAGLLAFGSLRRASRSMLDQ